jgi:hypothetical protein
MMTILLGWFIEAPVFPKGISKVIETDYILTIISVASILIVVLFNLLFSYNTLLEFKTIMANTLAWLGTEETSLGNVAPDSSATAEQAAPPASGLARLWRNRNLAPKEATS